VKDSTDSAVVHLATSIILSLSFALRARWLLRPIMLIWLKYVIFVCLLFTMPVDLALDHGFDLRIFFRYIKDEVRRRESSLNAPASTNIVDLAPPYHVVDVPTEALKFEFELHEAASEGGVLWMQRLIDQNGFDPSTQDSGGASAMHFAALRGRSDAMSFLFERGVDVNIQDNSGCTPLSWLIMARQVEFGVDVEAWPDEWQHIYKKLVDRGAIAIFVRMFTFSV
jgi:ankyrin repeat protein